MIIECPICGARDMREFMYLGSAKLTARPAAQDPQKPSNKADQEAFFDYVYIRENPEGPHRELWLHEMGCRSYIEAERDTKTHEFISTQLSKPAKGDA